jgi:hypothetical protein
LKCVHLDAQSRPMNSSSSIDTTRVCHVTVTACHVVLTPQYYGHPHRGDICRLETVTSEVWTYQLMHCDVRERTEGDKGRKGIKTLKREVKSESVKGIISPECQRTLLKLSREQRPLVLLKDLAPVLNLTPTSQKTRCVSSGTWCHVCSGS